MGFPTNVTTVKITGRLLVSTVDGHRPTTERVAVPAKLQVEFTPEVIKVPAPGAQDGPTTFYRPDGDLPDMVRGVIDAEGYLCTPDPNNPVYPMFRGVRLMATDDDAVSVKDWTWRVTVKTTAGKVVESYSIAVPKAAALNGLDLTNLAPVPSTPGYGLPQAEAAAAAAAQDAQAAADAASRAESQIGATVTEGEVVGDDLILRRSNGETINAGDVRGPQGLPGPNSIPADEAVAGYIGTDATNTQTAGDNRWVTNEGADTTVSALFNAPDSAVQAAADARYSKRGELTINVADFGAKGDGTDETAKFQSAFDHVGALGGGEVFVPLPTFGQPYKVGKFYFPRNFRLRSAPGVVYRRAGLSWGGINRPFGNENSPLDNNTDPYSGHGNVEIIGGEWDGAYLDGGFLPGGFNCFMFIAARNILFQNVTVRDVVTNHAVDINGIDGMRIKGCRFLGFKDATTDQTRNYTEAIQIGPVADTVEGMGAWILHANGAASRNITIDDKCYFGPSGTPGTQAWPTGVGNHSAINRSRGLLTGGITITDCDFEGCTFMGVAVYTWDNVIIDKNRFSNCQIGIRANNFAQGRSWDTGLKDWVTAPLRENPSDLTIEKNTFTNTVDVDISVLGTGVSGVDGSWGWISDVLISGNTRRRTIAGRSTGQFIRALICKRITVEKNIGGWSSSGIALAGCEDQTVQANQIENTLGYGIIIDNTGGVAAMPAGNALVEANSVRNAGSHGIGINGVQGFSAVSNRVHNPARITNGAGILFSGSDSGLLSSNSVSATSTPFNINGLQGSNSTNTQVTLDNRIEGVTVRLTSLTGSGTTYGNIQYA